MYVKAIKDFSSTMLGNVKSGRIMDVQDEHAKHLVANGLCEPYQTNTYATKVVREVPSPAGTEKPSGSSRQARRSRSKTAKHSAASASSESTAASD